MLTGHVSLRYGGQQLVVREELQKPVSRLPVVVKRSGLGVDHIVDAFL